MSIATGVVIQEVCESCGKLPASVLKIFPDGVEFRVCGGCA